MMGYTHAAVGASAALGLALSLGDRSPELYIVASIAGALGGINVDIDAKDQRTNPKVTDAGRTRAAIISLIVIGLIIDSVFNTGIMAEIKSHMPFAICGLIGLIVLMIIGHLSEHRTFSHSILFVLLSSIAIGLIHPRAILYYAVGCTSHLILDTLNKPYRNHGIWLFYPLKTGKGIALGLCKSAGSGNKALYYTGIITFVLESLIYTSLINGFLLSSAIVFIMIYFTVCLYYVRVKSEREQRHIMHMRGEI